MVPKQERLDAAVWAKETKMKSVFCITDQSLLVLALHTLSRHGALGLLCHASCGATRN